MITLKMAFIHANSVKYLSPTGPKEIIKGSGKNEELWADVDAGTIHHKHEDNKDTWIRSSLIELETD